MNPFRAIVAVFSCCLIQNALAQDKPRVYVTDSSSWETHGAAGGVNGTFAASSSGGARPQTAEIIKTLGQRCHGVIANNHADASDYVIELDHEGGKGMLSHKDKVAVFVRTTGDSIFSKSTLSVGGSVQDACAAILSHWGAHAAELHTQATVANVATANVPAVQSITPSAAVVGHLTLISNPDHADIMVNGSFVGSTPSTLDLPTGDADVVIEKKGYKPWNRKMRVTGGTISVNADLEQLANN